MPAILARDNSFGHARMNYGLTTQQRQGYPHQELSLAVIFPGRDGEARATSRTRIASELGISRVWPSVVCVGGAHREGEEP
jgi:hypothetical protein